MMTTAQYPNSLRDRDTYMPVVVVVVVVVVVAAAVAVALDDPLRQCEFHTRTAMKRPLPGLFIRVFNV